MKSAPIISIGDVTIPLGDFAVAGTAWLGIKKAGKTYGAKGVAEQLIEHGVPLIVFDAIGLWRFLKTPGDGNGGKGYKVVVAGGEEPDIPLTAQNASEIIRAAMRSNVSLILDLYDPKLSKADWRKIVQAGFHTLLYENKQHGPRYIILEEAAEYVPQKVYDGETYAAVEKTVRMGGNVGLGVALINPRSQELNKAVLDLCDNLILMRQRGSAAIDAVQKWMDKVNPEIADEITTSLPKISGGEGWVWAENSETPAFTKTHKLHSFHPDRTKHGENIKARQSVDTAEFVSTLLSELPKVVEEKKANDPAELKRKVSDLEKKLRVMEQQVPEIKQAEPIKVPVFDDAAKNLLEKVEHLCERVIQDDRERVIHFQNLTAQLSSMRGEIALRLKTPLTGPRMSSNRCAAPIQKAIVRPVGDVSTNGHLSPTCQKILNAMAELETLRVEKPVREMVALMAGYTNLASTGYVKAVSQLSTENLVYYPDSGTIAFTDEGRGKARFTNSPRTSQEIQDRVCNIIGGKSAEILRPLIDAYPKALERQDVAASAGYTNLASTGFVKAVSRLRTLGFIDYPDKQTMVATPVLFLE